MRKSNKGKRILLIFKRLFALALVIASTATLVTIFVGGVTKVYADDTDPDQAELERLYFQDGEGLDALNLNEPLNEVGEVNYQQVDYGDVPLLDDYAWDNVIAAGNAAEKEQEKEKAKEAGKEAKKGKTEAAVLRERCKSIGKTIHAVGGLIAAAIKGGDLGPHIVNLTKSTINLVVTLMNKIPGFGEVTDAIFDTVIGIIEAFDGSKQSDTDRLMNFIEDQINLVRDDVAKTRQDIVELSSKMDEGFNEILTALKDSFDNYEAKTHVNNFFSTASGNFSYTQLKRYLYSNYSDGYALELQSQIAKENPNQERITTLENELYASLMSTYNGTTSYLEMFYDSIMKTEGHNSIFKYYCDYLNSNSKALNNTSPAVASAEFMNDVYCTFMTAVNYVRLLNQSQKSQMILRVQDTQNPNYDDLKYVYGPNQHDYVTYNDIEKIDKRLEEMLDNVDYQISQDLAYISKLDKTYFYKSSDNVFRVATNTNANTFGNVEKGFTLYLPQLNQYISELFGYNVNNFRYILTDSDNHQLNEGQEDKSTYIVNTDKPFVLTVKYDVTDRSGNPITTTDSNGNSIPLVYDVYQIPFKVGVKNSFSGGNGKANDPYIISNAEQFMLIPGLDRHTCYSLVADLDLGGKTIEQMFDDIKPYAGTFNGNGFTINNFKIGKSQKQSSLFGFIAATGNVCNLTVKNADVNKDNDDDSTKMEAAIIAGVNNGSIGRVIIDSCTIKAVRVSNANNDNVNKAITNYTGAIAAENYGSITYCRVKNCTISGYSKREYGSNSDGLNSNDVYAGGAVGYNGSGATLSYVSVDSITKVSAEGNGIADKSLSTRSPRVKAYAGGVIGSAGDRANINNLYSLTENVTASAKALNDSSWGITSKSNAKSKTSQYIAGETTGNISRTSDFEFKKRNEYDIELVFSERINQTYNIDESLIFYAGASAFSVSDMKFKVKKSSSKKIYTLDGVIVSVEGFDSTNTSYTEAKKGKAEIIVYVKDLNAVLRYSVPYCILPDKPTSIAVVGAVNTEFTYSADESAKIVDASASQQLQTTTIRVAHQSGRETNVADTATISVDTTILGKQKAIIKAENHEFEFDVNVVCSGHDWIDSTAVTVIEGFEKLEDNATHEIYYSVYGYVSKECANCHTIGRFAFNKTCQAELINEVPATCSTLGYKGDKVAYYIDANTHEKVYLDCIVEKGTIVEQLPHTFTHEDNLVGGSHYDDYGHTCSVCGYLEPHLYSPVENSGEIVNGIVYKCDICGHTYIKDNISREDITKLPRVVVNNAYTLAGTQEVVVYVDLHSSVGITSANFSVSFDPELTLISYRLGNILNDANISRFKVYPDHLNVVLAQTSTDVSTDGTILRLVFETPANSAVNSRYKIDVVNKGNTDRFTDKNGNKVEFLSYEGYINVVDRLPGDVNGDGSLDMLDILIVSKYIVLDDIEKLNYIIEMRKLNPELSILYADVNLDNIIDTDDVVRMLRFDVGGYESQVVSQKFIVNLNYNDGSGKVEPYQVDFNYGDGKYGALPTVKKAGYRFDGWYTDIEGGDLITSVTPVKYNNDQYVQTLYAHFTLNKIIFDSNGGTGEKPAITISTNSNDMNFGASDKNGNEYFFKEATVRFDTNISVTVLDKVDTYRLTFLGWSTSKNGNAISNISSLYDLSNFADLQIGTVTLYAVWKEIEIDNYLPDVSSIAGYSGYTLTGWMLKKVGKASDVVFEPTETKYAINDSITFYAKWDIVSFTLVYDGNGGKLTNGYSKYYETDRRTSIATLALIDIDLLGFKKTGYTFAGWTTDQAFAETWFYLVKKNYNTIISAFDYVYYDGEVRTVTDEDFVYVNGAVLQALGNPNPEVTKNSSNFITAGLGGDLEKFIDENGFVTLYALWTPNKIEITYNTDQDDAVLKGTSSPAKTSPVTLPYYYGYDIILPIDIYNVPFTNNCGSTFYRIEDIRLSNLTDQLNAETYNESNKVIYSCDLPAGNRSVSATVTFQESEIHYHDIYFHYLYNGYEFYTHKYIYGYSDDFISDLSAIGISKDYYTISEYLSIVDSDGKDGCDMNNDGVISDNEKYINNYKPGNGIRVSLIGTDMTYPLTIENVHPDLYIEVKIIGERKLFAEYTAPFVLGDNNTLILNGIGDYSPIRDNNTNDVLIIPDLIRVNGEVRKVNEVLCQTLQPISTYYDPSTVHKAFKSIVFGNNIETIHREFTEYLDYVEELVLPGESYHCWISSDLTNIKRIVLSDVSSLRRLTLPKSNTIIDIYYRGSYEHFMELMLDYPTHPIFNKDQYRIKFYSETEPVISGIPYDNYWHYDNGLRLWAN